MQLRHIVQSSSLSFCLDQEMKDNVWTVSIYLQQKASNIFLFTSMLWFFFVCISFVLESERHYIWKRHQNWKCHRAVWRPPDFREKTQTEVVRACHTIIWTGQDYPTGDSSRRETKRQTEEQHQRVDWSWMEYHTTESWEPRGVEEAGCKIYSGAPTVSQTMGQIR